MIYRRENNKVHEVKNLKLMHKKHLSPTFEEDTVRSIAAALDERELAWAVDELIKKGRIRGAVII